MPIINSIINYIIPNGKSKSRLLKNNFKCINNQVIISMTELYTIFPGSEHIFLNCICDYCNIEFKISCRKLTRSQGKSKTKSEQKEYQDNLTLCNKCRSKQTTYYRYGVDSVNKVKQITEKKLQTRNNKTLQEKQAIIQKQKLTIANKSKEEKEKIVQKRKNTNLIKYGTEIPARNIIIKQKILNTVYSFSEDKKCTISNKRKQTNLEKYGVEYLMQSKKIQDKAKQINLEKYGAEYPIQAQEIKEKIKQTNLERYGVEYSIQNSNIYSKMQQTNLKKYGFKFPMQNKEIQAKVRQTMYKNNTCPTSKQQLYFFNLLKNNESDKENIQLNYPLNNLSLDIVLLKEKLDIEYNGGGHNLDVRLHGCTQKQFKQREIRRNYLIKSYFNVIIK